MAEERLDFNMDGNASGAIRQLTQLISAAENAKTTATSASTTIRNALGSINNVTLRNKLLGNLPTESQQATTALNGTRQALQSITGVKPPSDPLGSLPEDAREAQAEIARLRRELQQLQSQKVGNVLGGINPAPINGASGALATLRGNAVSAAASMSPLGGSIASLGAGVAGGAILGVGAAIVGVGAAALGAASQVQTYKAQLTTVIGDADRAGAAFQSLAKFAQETPFSLDQAVDGFVKLKALGLTPSEAALTSYGNTAAAMGKDARHIRRRKLWMALWPGRHTPDHPCQFHCDDGGATRGLPLSRFPFRQAARLGQDAAPLPPALRSA